VFDRSRLLSEGFAWSRGLAAVLGIPAIEPTAPVRDVLGAEGPLRALALAPELRNLASQALEVSAHAVRAVLFVKSALADWWVPWHQDRVVAVQSRAPATGFSGWSVKDAIPHANAPASLLEDMVTLRVHLDACPPGAGPLEVVPGSHGLGILTPDVRSKLARESAIVSCLADRGDVLVMRPLLLHRSRSRCSPASRRVLHIEYAARPLPTPLVWRHWALPPPGPTADPPA
jgi:hypothetical protein